MDIIMYTKPKLYEKYGHIFYNITETRVDFNMSGLQLHLDNLFNGIKLLGELHSNVSYFIYCSINLFISTLEII